MNRPEPGGLAPDAAAAVADALRTLGDELADWSRAGALPEGTIVDSDFVDTAFVDTDFVDTAFEDIAFEDIVFGAGIGAGGDSSDAVFGSLGVDAAIDTNATVSQRSLREFLS